MGLKTNRAIKIEMSKLIEPRYLTSTIDSNSWISNTGLREPPNSPQIRQALEEHLATTTTIAESPIQNYN
jgi:hypothetical protein